MRTLAVVVCLLSLSALARADVLPTGTWVQRARTTPMSMTVEAAGNGLRLTYRIVDPKGSVAVLMTIVTELDGKDAPVLVNGKPSGETMAIRRIDSRHTFTVLKQDGKEIGTSKSELSADGKVLKVENMMKGTETRVEYWDKK